MADASISNLMATESVVDRVSRKMRPIDALLVSGSRNPVLMGRNDAVSYWQLTDGTSLMSDTLARLRMDSVDELLLFFPQ